MRKQKVLLLNGEITLLYFLLLHTVEENDLPHVHPHDPRKVKVGRRRVPQRHLRARSTTYGVGRPVPLLFLYPFVEAQQPLINATELKEGQFDSPNSSDRDNTGSLTLDSSLWPGPMRSVTRDVKGNTSGLKYRVRGGQEKKKVAVNKIL